MSPETTEQEAPYAYPNAVLGLIHRYREGALPDPITPSALKPFGISPNNAHWLLGALGFLGLIDAAGRSPGYFERLRRRRSWVVGDTAKGDRVMTEASGGGSRAEIERRLINRSMEDEHFRQKLLDDPKGTVEQELGDRLPESMEVRAVEETADTIYLVLPSASAVGGEGGELSDQELEAVAGGDTFDCTDTCPRQCY